MWWSIVGLGASCFVSSTDKKTALKGYQVWEGGRLRAMCGHDSEAVLAREDLVYKHLGPHPQILCCYGLEEVHPGINSLRIEYAPLGDVRKFIETRKGEPLGWETRLRMALDVALGLSHVHKMGVQHCDLTCRNLFMFEDYRVKIGDFGGSLIQGKDDARSLVYEASAYQLPCRGRDFKKRPARERELFALGSAIYEITAWGEPCAGMEDDEIEKNYAAGVFPSLEGLPTGNVIRKCWEEKYTSADEVVEALEALIASHDEANVSKDSDGDTTRKPHNPEANTTDN